jgi:hypothetical protein
MRHSRREGSKMENEERKAYLNGFKKMIEFLEDHPDLPISSSYCSFLSYQWDKDELTRLVKLLGSCDKEYSEHYFTISKSFGPIKYGFQTSREKVCERIVIGKKIVPARPAQLIPEEPAHEEDIVKWECKSILEATENA